jgi:hypothetical protein
MLQAIQRIPVLLTLYAGFGLLIHDTQIDSATIEAISKPVAAEHSTVTNSSDNVSKISTRTPHVHVDGVSVKKSVRNMNSNQPAIHPRSESEKKVVAQRRASGNDLGHDFVQPI